MLIARFVAIASRRRRCQHVFLAARSLALLEFVWRAAHIEVYGRKIEQRTQNN